MTITLTNVENVTDDLAQALAGAGGMISVNIGGVDYLYVAGKIDSSLNAYRLNADGTVNFLDAILDSDDPLYELNNVDKLTLAEIAGESYLIAHGRADDGISIFRINADGSLSNTYNVTDDNTLALKQVLESVTVTVNGNTYLYVTGETDDGISIFALHPGGTLTFVDSVVDTDGAPLLLDGVTGVTTAKVAGVDYLFTSSYADGGVSVFKVNPGGTLQNTFNLADNSTTLMAGAFDIEVAQVNGITYVYVLGNLENGVTVLRADPGGTLTYVGIVADDAILGLTSSRDIKVMEIGGRSYLAVASPADHEVSLFRVNDDGTLTNFANETDNATLKLQGVIGLEFTMIDGLPYLYTGSYTDSGFSGFRLNFPITISNASGAYDVSETLAGAASVAVAKSTISVSSDVLYSTGAEFVNVNADQLVFDLSIGVNATFYIGELVDYLTVLGTGTTTIYGKISGDDRITGGAGQDTVYASGGNDVVKTKGGDDIVYLGTGDDRVFGDTGNETLYGGTGSDRLFGQGGNDQMFGQSGADFLYGGAGNDTVNGGGGNDIVKGDQGADTLLGHTGNDRIYGGTGNDTIYGQTGRDYLYGDAGDDRLFGGTQNDSMTGGAGADEFVYRNNPTEGYDKIKDFQNGIDTIDLTDFGFANFAAISALSTQIAAGVKINFGGGNVLLLEGFSLADFNAADVLI